MATEVLPPVDSFRLDLPSSWVQLAIDQREVSKLLAEQQADNPWQLLTALQKRQAELYLRRVVADIQAADVRLAALYLEVDQGNDPDGQSEVDLAAAACVVSVVSQTALGSELPLTPAVMQAAMSATPRDGRRSTDLDVPRIVALQHAQAVLVRRVAEVASGDKEPIKFITETYFVTVPDEHNQVIAVQFSTPNLADAELFSELFAAIAGTIRLYRTGEETAL